MRRYPKGVLSVGIVIIVVLFLAIGLVIYFVATKDKDDSNSNTPVSNTQLSNSEISNSNGPLNANQPTNSITTNSGQESTPGEYDIYSVEKFNKAEGKKRVLFFYAAWCPTCRPADANISANENQIPENVVVFRTDYDNETQLKAKYGVTYQHTFVQVDDNGNAIKKWNGGDIDEIIKNVI